MKLWHCDEKIFVITFAWQLRIVHSWVSNCKENEDALCVKQLFRANRDFRHKLNQKSKDEFFQFTQWTSRVHIISKYLSQFINGLDHENRQDMASLVSALWERYISFTMLMVFCMAKKKSILCLLGMIKSVMGTLHWSDIWPGAPEDLGWQRFAVALLDQTRDVCQGQAAQLHLVPNQDLEINKVKIN